MRVIDLLVQRPARDEEIEGGLEVFLGLVEHRVEAIPAGRPQSAGGIYQAGKGQGHHFVGRIDQRDLVHAVRVRIVEILVITDLAAEPTDAAQIGLHIRAPLPFWPTGSAHLKTNRGIGRKGRGATGCRGIQSIATRIRADAVVVHLVKVIVLVARGRLLFCRAAHSPLSVGYELLSNTERFQLPFKCFYHRILFLLDLLFDNGKPF